MESVTAVEKQGKDSDNHLGPQSDEHSRATEREWGIPMPPKSRLVHSEEKPGFHGQSESTIWVATETPVSETAAHFAGQPGAGEPYSLASYSSCVSIEEIRVCLTGPEETPVTRIAPRRAITERTPANTKAWVIMYQQGQPPPCPPCPPKFKGTTAHGCTCP